jgi:hypothetical protein
LGIGVSTVTTGYRLEVRDGGFLINHTFSEGFLAVTNGFGRGFRISSAGNFNGGQLQNFDGSNPALSWGNGQVGIGTGMTFNSSAILELASTTRGFLLPRMTTTQINAISAPENGLEVYNTTINHKCVYQAGAWVKLSHSPM